MGTILYAWELGGGLGHLLRFLPLAERLVARGHRVIAALRELKNADYVFGGTEVSYFPAPHLAWGVPGLIDPIHTYAELLHDVGFLTSDALRLLTRAWQSLFAVCQPDLVICDHSPTALLAASFDSLAACNLGTGFCCPPTGRTLPVLRTWMPANREQWAKTERMVLANVNSIRKNYGKPAWDELSALYGSAQETFLTTFAELDHFSDRDKARYWGVWEARRGQAVEWPAGDGPRVFMYTHRFSARDWLLGHLRKNGLPTVAYSHDLSTDAIEKLAGPTMSLATAPLDIAQAAAECDIAILNAGHNSVAQMLLAGKSVLLVPITLEQGLLAMKLVKQGLAISAGCNKQDEIRTALAGLLADRHGQAAVQALSADYASYDPSAAQHEIVSRLEKLAGGASS